MDKIKQKSLKRRAESDKQLVAARDSFRSPKVVKLEQENQALKAMVEEMRERLNAFVELKDSGLSEPARIGLQTEFARDTLCNTPQQSLDTLKVEIEEETIERLTGFLIENGFKIGKLIKTYYEIHGGKYQLPTDENQIGSKPQNPSCFKKQLGVEACNHGCPVSDECYRSEG